MNILENIIMLENKELNEYIKNRIEILEYKKLLKNNTIGYILDYNPSICNKEKDFTYTIDVNPCYVGYIPIGTRVVYGIVYNKELNTVSNGGMFYYIDDDSYIYEFCNYIKDENVSDSFELFGYIYDFIEHYFFGLQTIDRNKMMKLILKKDNIYYPPININTYSMFKNKGNALCSEVGIMAQNILSFLGYKTLFIIGTEQSNNSNIGAHAYNMVSFEEDTKYSTLIDFSSSACVVDINFKKIGESPFIYYLDNDIEYEYNEMINNNKSIVTPEYSYLLQDSTIWMVVHDSNRIYRSAQDLKNVREEVENKKNYSKIMTKRN